MVAPISDAVTERSISTCTYWRKPARSGPASCALCCFPHAGGGTAAYRRWASLLPAGVELLALELPGREAKVAAPPLGSFEAIVDGAAAALPAATSAPRVVLFGHSFGALVAHAVALRLSARTPRPRVSALVVSGERPPDARRDRVDVRGLDDEAFLSLARTIGGLPDEVLAEPQLVELLLPALRADFEAYAGYVPADGGRLDCDVVVLGGRDDLRLPLDEALAWSATTTGGVHAHVYNGGHFYLVERWAAVARRVSSYLDPEGAP